MTRGWLVVWIWIAVDVILVWLMWRHAAARRRLRATTRMRFYDRPHLDVGDVININGRWRRVIESDGRDVTVEDMDDD